ncbi:MAG: TIGR01777 family protein [Chloroflexi bacterium]|nr:TIGR01777 family protein [Chloroflexota bacterium]
MRVAITGSTGLIGGALAARLEGAGHEVLRIRRGSEDDPSADWDPAGGWIRGGAFAGHDAIVNLSGANIGGGRWSAARRAELRSSRIDLTRVLVDHLGSLAEGDRPGVLVNQSAVGFYGDRDDEELDEDAARGAGFLADLVADWEAEAVRAEDLGIRTVRHRSAIVLSKQGPPLSRMLLPFRLGLGGTLGNGRWWMPWITLEDQLRSLEHAITSDISGAVNASAPGATTNGELTKALGRALRRPTLFPIPGFAYKLAFGQDPAELFASQRIVPRALADSGFAFSHPDIDGALEAVLAG